MKKISLTLVGFAAILLTVTATEPILPTKNSSIQIQNGEAYHSAVQVTPGEMTELITAYQAKNPGETWGGSIRKQDLKALISSMSPTSTFVNFRFAIDTTTHGFTSLMISGEQSPNDVSCIRNGGTDIAFCPTACNTEELTSPMALPVLYADYLKMSHTFKESYPEKTGGGNIDKAALLEIINSHPTESDRIHFRFCLDPATNQTSVIFVGGHKNQPTPDILIYRNGKTADAFCPTNCSRR